MATERLCWWLLAARKAATLRLVGTQGRLREHASFRERARQNRMRQRAGESRKKLSKTGRDAKFCKLAVRGCAAARKFVSVTRLNSKLTLVTKQMSRINTATDQPTLLKF